MKPTNKYYPIWVSLSLIAVPWIFVTVTLLISRWAANHH